MNEWWIAFWRWLNNIPAPPKRPHPYTPQPQPPLPAPPPLPSPPIIPRRVDRTFGERVKDAMLARNYPWYTGPGAQNVVSVEGHDPDGTRNDNRHDAFDDIKMVLDGDGKIIGGPWCATTQPGVYFTENPMAAGGAFIIALGPQACWTPGPYHGKTVWRQAEESTILGHRDPEGTFKRNGKPIVHGNIGVHHHDGYNMPRNNIGRTAAGCQVIEDEDDQQEFMRLTLKNPKYLANKDDYRLMATVLGQDEVDER